MAAQLGQADHARLAQRLYVQQPPARGFGLGLGVVIGRAGVELGGVGPGAFDNINQDFVEPFNIQG